MRNTMIYYTYTDISFRQNINHLLRFIQFINNYSSQCAIVRLSTNKKFGFWKPMVLIFMQYSTYRILSILTYRRIVRTKYIVFVMGIVCIILL